MAQQCLYHDSIDSPISNLCGSGCNCACSSHFSSTSGFDVGGSPALRDSARNECAKRPVSFFKDTGHNTGDNLLSHPSVGALPSAVTGLTSVFEKGTCVSLHLWSPEWCS